MSMACVNKVVYGAGLLRIRGSDGHIVRCHHGIIGTGTRSNDELGEEKEAGTRGCDTTPAATPF